MDDAVNHPSHYTRGPVEVIDIIEGFGLNYHLGNVTKYVLRAGHKNDALEDLKKARWYIDREIERQDIMAPKREHSRKPGIVRDEISRVPQAGNVRPRDSSGVGRLR